MPVPTKHTSQGQGSHGPDLLGSLNALTHVRLARALANARAHPETADWSRLSLATGDLGIAVFATSAFSEGQEILEFQGPEIDFSEAVAKGDWQCYPLQISSDRRYIDLQEPACFVNHSCDPNAGLRGLVLVAMRSIAPGEEIRYDYSTTMDENYWEMPCRCGAAVCRSRVRDFKYLSPQLRADYLARGVVQPFIAQQYDAFPSRAAARTL